MPPTPGQAPGAKAPPTDSRRRPGALPLNMKVRLFIKPFCGWCDQAMDWLHPPGGKYESLRGLGHARARQEKEGGSGQTLAPRLDRGGQILYHFDPRPVE